MVRYGVLFFMAGVSNVNEGIVWTFFGLTSNAVVGASILSILDNDEADLFKWFKECPVPVLGHFLILTLWPAVAYFFLKRK